MDTFIRLLIGLPVLFFVLAPLAYHSVFGVFVMFIAMAFIFAGKGN